LQGENPLVEEHGLPSQGSEFWEKVDPFFFINNINAPIQLQPATGDESVPVELSWSLRDKLKEEGKTVEYIEYQGDDHNIGQNSALAWKRTIDFFNKNFQSK
jgi:dipeptidyl aminopeptidase/acylaminoacyl peptidase